MLVIYLKYEFTSPANNFKKRKGFRDLPKIEGIVEGTGSYTVIAEGLRR